MNSNSGTSNLEIPTKFIGLENVLLLILKSMEMHSVWTEWVRYRWSA